MILRSFYSFYNTLLDTLKIFNDLGFVCSISIRVEIRNLSIEFHGIIVIVTESNVERYRYKFNPPILNRSYTIHRTRTIAQTIFSIGLIPILDKRKSFIRPWSRQEPKLFNQSSVKNFFFNLLVAVGVGVLFLEISRKVTISSRFDRLAVVELRKPTFEHWRAYSVEPQRSVISFRACCNIYISPREERNGEIRFAEFETESFISRAIVSRLRPVWQIPSWFERLRTIVVSKKSACITSLKVAKVNLRTSFHGF